MNRTFPMLAAAGASALLAAFVLGLFAAGDPAWRGAHRAASIVATAAVVGVHATLSAFFARARRRAEASARAFGLPDWIAAQAGRAGRRTAVLVVGGVASVLAASALGLAVDAPRTARALAHLAASAFAIGFNLVAFAVEFAGLLAHRRLLRDARPQADATSQS